MKDIKAGDLMVSLEDYAVVSEGTTIIEAVRALEEAQRGLKPGHHRHRAVLVVDDDGRIVGKVGHFAFLKGLEPNYGQLGDWDSISRAGLSRSFIPTLLDSLHLWRQSVDDMCDLAKTTRVSEIMRPVEISVDHAAPLTEAVHLFVIHQTLSLPVTRDGEVVGILRLADVFTTVFGRLSACAWEEPPSTGEPAP